MGAERSLSQRACESDPSEPENVFVRVGRSPLPRPRSEPGPRTNGERWCFLTGKRDRVSRVDLPRPLPRPHFCCRWCGWPIRSPPCRCPFCGHSEGRGSGDLEAAAWKADSPVTPGERVAAWPSPRCWLACPPPGAAPVSASLPVNPAEPVLASQLHADSEEDPTSASLGFALEVTPGIIKT